jgi:uncharacterized small protein (DUF1192 family)
VNEPEIRERYAAKVRAHEGLTSTAVVGPFLGRLQIYAVTAAVSADDVPVLLDEIARLKAQLGAAEETAGRENEVLSGDAVAPGLLEGDALH